MNGAIIGLGHGHRVISKAFEIENIKLIGVYSKNLLSIISFKNMTHLKNLNPFCLIQI